MNERSVRQPVRKSALLPATNKLLSIMKRDSRRPAGGKASINGRMALGACPHFPHGVRLGMSIASCWKGKWPPCIDWAGHIQNEGCDPTQTTMVSAGCKPRAVESHTARQAGFHSLSFTTLLDLIKANIANSTCTRRGHVAWAAHAGSAKRARAAGEGEAGCLAAGAGLDAAPTVGRGRDRGSKCWPPGCRPPRPARPAVRPSFLHTFSEGMQMGSINLIFYIEHKNIYAGICSQT